MSAARKSIMGNLSAPQLIWFFIRSTELPFIFHWNLCEDTVSTQIYSVLNVDGVVLLDLVSPLILRLTILWFHVSRSHKALLFWFQQFMPLNAHIPIDYLTWYKKRYKIQVTRIIPKIKQTSSTRQSTMPPLKRFKVRQRTLPIPAPGCLWIGCPRPILQIWRVGRTVQQHLLQLINT